MVVSSVVCTDQVDIYDSGSGEWTSMELSQPRLGIGAAVVGDKIIFAGGANLRLM